MGTQEQMAELTTAAARATPAIRRLALVLTHVGVAAATWAVAMKKLEAKYAALADAEISEAREHYEKSRVVLQPAYDTPEEAVQAMLTGEQQVDLTAAVEAIQLYRGHRGGNDVPPAKLQDMIVETSVELTPVVKNVFTNAEPSDFIPDELIKARDSEKPYVITQDEYIANEFEYTQTSFTYYLGDEVLAAEDDSVVENVDYTVGSDNLQRFGVGSEDPNIVYVRNAKLELEYEVHVSYGKYSVEVAGFDDDSLQHSYKVPRRRQHLVDD